MLTKQQSDAQLIQWGAAFVTNRDGIEWWRLPSGQWIARRETNGMYELRSFPASACNC